MSNATCCPCLVISSSFCSNLLHPVMVPLSYMDNRNCPNTAQVVPHPSLDSMIATMALSIPVTRSVPRSPVSSRARQLAILSSLTLVLLGSNSGGSLLSPGSFPWGAGAFFAQLLASAVVGFGAGHFQEFFLQLGRLVLVRYLLRARIMSLVDCREIHRSTEVRGSPCGRIIILRRKLRCTVQLDR